jgi:hypothetical protein
MLSQKREPRRRNSDHRASAGIFRRHETSIVRILPDRKPGTRRTPSVHHFGVASLTGFEPAKEIEDEMLYYRVTHELLFPRLYRVYRTASAGRRRLSTGASPLGGGLCTARCRLD